MTNDLKHATMNITKERAVGLDLDSEEKKKIKVRSLS